MIKIIYHLPAFFRGIGKKQLLKNIPWDPSWVGFSKVPHLQDLRRKRNPWSWSRPCVAWRDPPEVVWVVWVEGGMACGVRLSPIFLGEISENITDHIFEKKLLKERRNQMLKLSFVWGLKKTWYTVPFQQETWENICMETSHWEIFNSTVNSEIANQSIIDRITYWRKSLVFWR